MRAATTWVVTKASLASPGTALPLPGRWTATQLPTVMPSCTLSSCRTRRLRGSGRLAMTISTLGSVLPTVYLTLTWYSPWVNCLVSPGRRGTSWAVPLWMPTCT